MAPAAGGGFPAATKAGLLMAILFILINLCAFGTCQYSRVHLHITNNIQHSMQEFTNGTLLVHCKSGDDDLGEQYLHLKETYSFSFKPRFGGSTLFWCHMWWRLVDGREVWADFDIYSRKEQAQCKKECFWEGADDGIYKTENGVSILAYHWNI